MEVEPSAAEEALRRATIEAMRAGAGPAGAIVQPTVRAVVEQASYKRSERQIVTRSDNFMLRAMLRSWSVEQAEQGQLLRVDVARLRDDCEDALGVEFDSDCENPVPELRMSVQSAYRALRAMKPEVSERAIDGLRPFFNDPAIRRAISPVRVDRKRTTGGSAPIEEVRERSKLSIRRRSS